MKPYHPDKSLFAKCLYKLHRWLKYERITIFTSGGSDYPMPAATGSSRNTVIACSIPEVVASEAIRIAAHKYARVRCRLKVADQISWIQAGNKAGLTIKPQKLSDAYNIRISSGYWYARGENDRQMLTALVRKQLKKSPLKNRGYLIWVTNEIEIVQLENFSKLAAKYKARLRIVVFSKDAYSIKADQPDIPQTYYVQTERQLNKCFRNLATEDVNKNKINSS